MGRGCLPGLNAYSRQYDLIFVQILVCNILSAQMSLPHLEELVLPALIQCNGCAFLRPETYGIHSISCLSACGRKFG
jgi:hypothetical protein